MIPFWLYEMLPSRVQIWYLVRMLDPKRSPLDEQTRLAAVHKTRRVLRAWQEANR
jgi:hypothetical protein